MICLLWSKTSLIMIWWGPLITQPNPPNPIHQTQPSLKYECLNYEVSKLQSKKVAHIWRFQNSNSKFWDKSLFANEMMWSDCNSFFIRLSLTFIGGAGLPWLNLRRWVARIWSFKKSEIWKSDFEIPILWIYFSFTVALLIRINTLDYSWKEYMWFPLPTFTLISPQLFCS